MGVYIKGMAMPKNCYGCPFFTQVDYWNKNDEADILSKCKRTGAFTWESVDAYLPNCPLIPVPAPHGRLIDADALIKSLSLDEDDAENGASLLMAIFLEVLKAAPTIIEAEEGET